MKKKLLITLSASFILANFFVLVNANQNDTSSYSAKVKYDLYEERVRNICDKYQYEKNNKNNNKIKFLININDNYKKIKEGYPYSLPIIKNTHKNNMNNIYKCALLNVQKKSLLLIKNDLINKNANLWKKVGPKIRNKINKIELQLSSLKCINWKEKNSIQKLNVLHQATYQTCKYINYLEYLRERNIVIKNIIPEWKETYSISEVQRIERKKVNEIDREISNTYKVFPIAYNAYTEYENNITIHFLLQLLKEDYITLREKLYKALNPINQVVYKISNAMKK